MFQQADLPNIRVVSGSDVSVDRGKCTDLPSGRLGPLHVRERLFGVGGWREWVPPPFPIAIGSSAAGVALMGRGVNVHQRPMARSSRTALRLPLSVEISV